MSLASRVHPKRVLRRLASPFRGFFNRHFGMVKDEIQASRAEVSTASRELANAADRLAAESTKMDDSATFLGMRLARLMERQEHALSSLAGIEARLAVLGAPSGDSGRGADAAGGRHPLWYAFVGRTLAGVDAGTGVLVLGDDDLQAIVGALGYEIADRASSDHLPTAAVVDVAYEDSLALATDPLVASGGVLVVASADHGRQTLPAGWTLDEQVREGPLTLRTLRRN